MRMLWLYLLLFPLQLSVKAQSMTAEDYYVSAFNEMSDMLAGRNSLSIKRTVFLAEWAYYEGNLDYKTDEVVGSNDSGLFNEKRKYLR